MLRNLVTALALGASFGLVNADGIYTKNSPVLQISAKTYDSVIAQSNHTSVSCCANGLDLWLIIG
jgi:hypothetical protein